jgi:hypothetical protein
MKKHIVTEKEVRHAICVRGATLQLKLGIWMLSVVDPDLSCMRIRVVVF